MYASVPISLYSNLCVMVKSSSLHYRGVLIRPRVHPCLGRIVYLLRHRFHHLMLKVFGRSPLIFLRAKVNINEEYYDYSNCYRSKVERIWPPTRPHSSSYTLISGSHFSVKSIASNDSHLDLVVTSS